MQADAILIPVPLAQAIHKYLMTQPMEDVEVLVIALRQCEPKDTTNDTV